MEGTGRKYREVEPFIDSWADFKKTWKTMNFVDNLRAMDQEQAEWLIREKLQQLLEDKTKRCYLFPDSLRFEVVGWIIGVIQERFSSSLHFQYENMYLDKQKQLLVFKPTTAVISYLSRYRLPESYKKTVQQLTLKLSQYTTKIIEMNKKISNQTDDLQQSYAAFQQFKKLRVEPFLEIYRKLVSRIIQDFQSQKNKKTLTFNDTRTIFTNQIPFLCQQFGLYYQYQFSSQYQELKTVLIAKEPIDEYEDQEDNVTQKEEKPTKQRYIPQKKEEKLQKQEKKISIQKKPSIPQEKITHTVKGSTKNGYEVLVSFDSFEDEKKELVVRTLYPKNKYEKSYPIEKGTDELFLTLDPVIHGYTCYEIKLKNEVGQSKEGTVIRVWNQTINDVKNEKGFYQLDKRLYKIFIYGENDEGIIPKKNGNDLILSTRGEWEKYQLGCCKLSVSSHVSLVNDVGDVAGWGAMYEFDPDLVAENQDDDELMMGSLSKLPIMSPCLLHENAQICHISSGEGYCLMTDSSGRAWSFGSNTHGELGLQHKNLALDTSEPTLIPYFTRNNCFVVSVVASSFGGSFAIDHEGNAYRWGLNQVSQTQLPIKNAFDDVINFQLKGTIFCIDTPEKMNSKVINKTITEIQTGRNFILAKTEAGEIYGWGHCAYLGQEFEDYGQITKDNVICNPIPIINNVRNFSVGGSHCVIRQENGQIYGWGMSNYFTNNIESQLIHKPFLIHESFQGSFYTGPDYTVYQQKDNAQIVGNLEYFKKKEVKLPSQRIKQIHCAKGILLCLVQDE